MRNLGPRLIAWLIIFTIKVPILYATTLTVAAYPSVDEIIRSAIPEWNITHPDIKIKIISRELSDHHTSMITALATSSHLPDVMVIESSYLGRFANSNGFENLSGERFNADRFRYKFVPYAISQATINNGNIIALPGDIGPGTLFYREDILKQSGVDPKKIIKSWEDFILCGIKIKSISHSYLVADVHDVKNAIIRSNLKQGEGIYFDQKRHVLVDTPRFYRAFQLAKKIREAHLDGNLKTWSSEWTESLRNGKVATQMMGAWFGGHLAQWIAPNTKGLWRVTNLPENSFIAWGGTFYAIPVHSTHPKLAFELVKLLTLDKRQQLNAFQKQDAFPALIDAQNDPFFYKPINFLGGQNARILWREASLKITAIPVDRLDPIANEVVDSALDRVLNDNVPITVALNEAKLILEYWVNRP